MAKTQTIKTIKMKMNQSKETLVRRMLHVPASLCVREAAEGTPRSRVITGYAILFDSPSEPLWSDEESEAREIIDRGAVTRELLDGQDIRMTMFHNNQLILARSKNGAGTLSYQVDEKGVSFEFEAPATVDGDKALELVRRGDISGCSFAFSTRYYDPDFVERTSVVGNGRMHITYRVKTIVSVYDFTLTVDPAYSDTSVEARELAASLREKPAGGVIATDPIGLREQLRRMREVARRSII